MPVAYGNIALNLLLEGKSGRLVSLRDGKYGDVDLTEVAATKKRVNIKKHYNPDRLRPEFRNFEKVRHITHEIDELDAQRKVARSRQHFHRHRPF